MKAAIRQVYGSPDVLKLEEIEKPIPKDDEILLKVHAASVNRADSHGLRGTPFMARIVLGGLRKPKTKILGYDFAGQVDAVGKEISEFHPGDEVFGTNKGAGGFAEYLCTTQDFLLIKPPNIFQKYFLKTQYLDLNYQKMTKKHRPLFLYKSQTLC